jgi:hypothetical protein
MLLRATGWTYQPRRCRLSSCATSSHYRCPEQDRGTTRPQASLSESGAGTKSCKSRRCRLCNVTYGEKTEHSSPEDAGCVASPHSIPRMCTGCGGMIDCQWGWVGLRHMLVTATIAKPQRDRLLAVRPSSWPLNCKAHQNFMACVHNDMREHNKCRPKHYCEVMT